MNNELVRIAVNYLTTKKKHKLATAVTDEIERLEAQRKQWFCQWCGCADCTNAEITLNKEQT